MGTVYQFPNSLWRLHPEIRKLICCPHIEKGRSIMKKASSIVFSLAAFLSMMAAGASDTPWAQAEKNAEQSQRAIQFCRRFSHGWLTHADPGSGLIPRNLTGDAHWNARDAAADNYPFIVLTAHILAHHYLKQIN